MPLNLIEHYKTQDVTVRVALVTAAASLVTSLITLAGVLFNNPIKYWFDNRALGYRLRAEYRYKNLTEFQSLTKKYKGMLLEAAEILDHRFLNLYRHEQDGWLNVNGNYANAEKRYFFSWVRRLSCLVAIATAFENEALYIDNSISTESDFQLIYVVKSWSLILSNLELFKGLSHVEDEEVDHFYRDTIRCVGEATWVRGHFVSDDCLKHLLSKDRDIQTVCGFLDGLNKSEPRLRWDRMVCLHLLVRLFLNQFGYEIHKSTDSQIRQILSNIRSPVIKANFLFLIKKWHLTKSKAGKSLSCLVLESIRSEIHS